MALAHPFVLEELQSLLSPDRLRVKAMFGSHALYVDEKIVFILRHRGTPDDGVWVALSDTAHAQSLSREFPTLRMIRGLFILYIQMYNYTNAITLSRGIVTAPAAHTAARPHSTAR